MPGNNAASSQVPRDSAIVILRTLGYQRPDADPGLLARVEKFVACNGAEGVRRAAEGIQARVASGKVADPWGYTVEAYNRSLAQLSHLYSLVNLVESGLRSRVDIGYTRAVGPHWHRTPHLYLPSQPPYVVINFVADGGQPRIRWAPAGPGRQPTQIEDLGSGAAFLQELTFGWLNQLVLHGYTARGALHDILLTADGQRITHSEATALLAAAKDTRNDVAHNKYVSPNAYETARRSLVRLLDLLRFDVPRTIQRMERERVRLMRGVFEQVGLQNPSGEAIARLGPRILASTFLPAFENWRFDEGALVDLRTAVAELG